MISPGGARMLVVEDESVDGQDIGRRALHDTLEQSGYRFTVASSAADALTILRREPIRIVIVDLGISETDGVELTGSIATEWPTIPVIIVASQDSIETAAEAMRLGASDFLLEPVDPSELRVRLAKCLDMGELHSKEPRAAATVEEATAYGEIVGRNREMQGIFRLIEKIARMPALVLIEGEPGTGKELIARAIHQRTIEHETEGKHFAAGDYPYVAVNCGAFTRTLLESQLFGYKKGAFTGAVADQEGVFVASGNGTLFLDEITELDLDLQVKLLRAIQEREVTPLGSNKPVPIRSRIITATNRPIADLVDKKKFRDDLYYRINVVSVKVPPLRERLDDLPILVNYFLASTAQRYIAGPREVTAPVMSAFQGYDWPGNVRELQNVIERAFALGESEGLITLDDLPQNLLAKVAGRAGAPGRSGNLFLTYDDVVCRHLVAALQVTRGVKSRAAELLKIDRNRLYRLMNKYKIKGDGF